MKNISAFLIDLNRSSSSALAQSLRSIFTSKNHLDIRLDEDAAFRPASNGSPVELAGRILRSDPDVVFMIMPEDPGAIEQALIRILSREPGRIPVVAVIEESRPGYMIELLKLGAVDFLTPPIRDIDVVPRIWRIVEHARKRETLPERLKETVGLKQIIGASAAFTAALDKIPFVAKCDSSVLISGETGTGKELFARAIHYLGPRSGRPFVPVNCGAIPVDLIENELFGHEKGAYTSAASSQHGLIRESDGGTLFLDEIDCLPLSAQVKFLRFLQEKEYRPLGSSRTARADIRIITATNTDLDQAVFQGSFRRDLFYRLNIIPLGLPPLRERREDIPLLSRHFMDHYTAEFHKDVTDIASDAVQKLMCYDWPGNVRELENVVERSVVFSTDRVLRGSDIELPVSEPSSFAGSFQEAKANVITQFEKKYIHGLLISHDGNITRAAKSAGKNRRAFWELIRKYEIDVASLRATRQ
ncbi:MAG: hypothetical protein A2X56_08655 [Nitrospirae bacterium GWC2_57_13]|jgi:two-component system, NtrC family, response regulator GlrR|nr:MAG: hypothetical protein A2072_08455 [Nitrospirae bacterium GWC1_57_7]OGW27999.1 MAG: hypothetical protein A2X56_08655 [Nitrospirae bacterium GWC2_57_13]OGW42849.1 MAG: hypothetical protein A2X57_01775 [Nitrospirae bacterium GWD2_57_8]HAR45556.1 hypothetical protein [Nitrospiraceae bacterium]